MTPPAQPRRVSPFAGQLVTFLASAWLLLSLGVAAGLTWFYVIDFHSCSDVARVGLPEALARGDLVAIPGFLGLMAGNRLRGHAWLHEFDRIMRGVAIVCVTLLIAGIVAPKPGLPCEVNRASLGSRLRTVANMQEAFKSDSQRYSASIDGLGAENEAYRNSRFQIRIAWADSTSWGAFVVYTDSTGPLRIWRWVCAIYFPDDSVTSHTIEGIGPLRNGCWDPARPRRLVPHDR